MVNKETIIRFKQYLNKNNIAFDKSLEESILKEKQQAIKEQNESVANEIWYLVSILKIQEMYINMFNLLKNDIYDDYEKAWNLREKIDIALIHHRGKKYYMDNFANLQFINLMIKRYKLLFPYKLFMSREGIIKKEKCSICGTERSIRNRCKHKVGQVYMGEMCYNIVEEYDFKAIAIVEDPEDEYTILKMDGIKFNYELLRHLMTGLNSPYDRWDVKCCRVKKDEYRKIGRNQLCPCGSNKKYKKCCLDTEKDSIPHYEIIYFDNPNIQYTKPYIISPTTND